MQRRKKVLLLRLDKIGDLICTLPVDDVLDENLFDVTWVVQKGLGPVIDLGKKKRKYLEIDKNNIEFGKRDLRDLLKLFKPDIAISFQCPWWINYELFKAKVPTRAGVKSQWHSFLFLNQGIRQKRSRAEKHEFEYNLDLVLNTFSLKEDKKFHYFEIEKPDNQNILTKHQLENKMYVVVHPGMMGSALNWPQTEYIKYIYKLIEDGYQVVITGTDQDEPYLTHIKKIFSENLSVTWLQSKLNLQELIVVLAYSEFVVAPSTGVAHLAASVNAHIKGIYSPVRVHHPKRWAPRGPNVEVFLLDENTLTTDIK